MRAGTLLPGNRTRGLAIFMLGGSLGLSLGPLLSGIVVDRWGLDGLIYLLPAMLVVIPVLCWGARTREGAETGKFSHATSECERDV
ncbi:MAG: hypothetical protein CM1200mP2_54620 [Planctomycetaceae bacterium]|nr:MAG: hypothetical protein CM1200mP2_54620 [Planctomycetaceae bacterium]